MRKIILSLFLLFIFSKTVYAGNVNIFYNDNMLSYKGIINEEDYVCIPLGVFQKMVQSELSWSEESLEVVMHTPVSIVRDNKDLDYIAELRVWIGQDTFYSRGLESLIKEPTEYIHAGKFAGGNVFILKDRTMVPVCENREQELLSIFNIFSIEAKYDGKENLYFTDYKEPEVQERYSSMAVDPDKWIGSFDTRYIKSFKIVWEKGKNNISSSNGYIYMDIIDKSGETKVYTMPMIPREAAFDGIYEVNGIKIRYKDGILFFDKEKFTKLMAGL